MATADDRRDTSIRPPGSKYPWDEWQNGRWWTIEKGDDFDVSIRVMRDQLHVRARSQDVRVRTHTDKLTKIQFTFQRAGETDEQFEERLKTPADNPAT